MKRTIVILAALGALATPMLATPAYAVTAECASLQAAYDGVQIREDIAQERLATATPAQKPGLVALILRLEAQLGDIRHQMDLAGCP
ncbi:hypothetical protein BJ973_008818 [Actinoplanes tereljensis]|uniref:Secreted protein n=1 Tax=Paractinoplanes tereljensis TaxID=571912 RepID=A0A919NGK6_9ACTN|nr:hypothetical protein [Actinoplanes tereljensis]GIF18219.1 hypothetical protein Ate02nite_09490 [Actinoplanes tereljensis]